MYYGCGKNIKGEMNLSYLTYEYTYIIHTV